MRIFALAAAALLFSSLGHVQDAMSADMLIESRQDEVAQLGVLYGIDLRAGVWTHQAVPVCPAFTHHIFARYDRTSNTGAMSSFIAIYSRDVGPSQSKSKPWDGGVVLLPLFGLRRGESVNPIERKETIGVFDHVWSDELKRSGSQDAFPSLTWQGLADCYIRLANEEPLRKIEEGTVSSPSIDLKGEKVSAVLTTIGGSGKNSRSVHIGFDVRGQVTEVRVNASPLAR